MKIQAVIFDFQIYLNKVDVSPINLGFCRISYCKINYSK